MPTCDTCQFVKKLTGRPSHSHFLVIVIKMVYPKKYKKIVHSDLVSPVLHSSAAQGSPSCAQTVVAASEGAQCVSFCNTFEAEARFERSTAADAANAAQLSDDGWLGQ